MTSGAITGLGSSRASRRLLRGEYAQRDHHVDLAIGQRAVQRRGGALQRPVAVKALLLRRQDVSGCRVARR